MSASRPSRGAGLVWPLAIFVLAAIPRIIGLDARPLWLDEVFTLQRVNLPAPALVVDSFTHHHMPSFFLLLAPLAPLGHPEFWLRLPSAVFGALAVVLVFLIAGRIAGRLAACLTASTVSARDRPSATTRTASCVPSGPVRIRCAAPATSW